MNSRTIAINKDISMIETKFTGALRWNKGILEQEVQIVTFKAWKPWKQEVEWREVTQIDEG